LVKKIELIRGRSGSGKSRYVLRLIQKLSIDPFKKIIVLVPEHMTYQTEKDIIELTAGKGLFGVEVLSLNRLSNRILECAGGLKGAVSDVSKYAMVHLAALRNKDKFKAFSSIYKKEGFDEAVVSLIGEFKKQELSFEDVFNIKVSNETLKNKFHDLAIIYESYEQFDKQDREDIMSSAIKKAAKAQIFNNATVIIDGFDSMTKQMFSLSCEAVKASSEAYVSLKSCKDKDKDAYIFEIPNALSDDFAYFGQSTGASINTVWLPNEELNILKRQSSKELSHLEQNLYADSFDVFKGEVKDISFYQAASKKDEAEKCASEIFKLVFEKGYRFNEIGIMADEESYSSTLNDVFLSNDIPVFIDKKTPLSNSSLAAFLLSALSIIEDNMRMSAIISHIKSGLSNLTINEQGIFLLCQKEFALRGNMLKKPIIYIEEKYGGFERIRKKLTDPIIKLETQLKGKNAGLKIDAILNFMENMEVSKKLEAESKELSDINFNTLSDICGQTYDKFKDMLSELRAVFNDEDIKTDELREIISFSASNVFISTIPPVKDEIKFCDIKKSKPGHIRALFILGLNSNYIPSNKNFGALLDLNEVTMLKDAGIKTSYNTNEEIERLDIYSALSAPKEKLYLSVPDKNHSIILKNICAIFPGMKVKTSFDEENLRLIGKNGTFKNMVVDLNAYLDGKKPAKNLSAVCNWFLSAEKYKPLIDRMERQLKFENEALKIDEKKTVPLYGDFSGSVSKLETFSECPYKFFLNNGLKIKEEKDFNDVRRDLGSICHSVLNLFFKGLIEDKKDLNDLNKAEINLRLDKSIKEVVEKGFFDDKRRMLLLALTKRQLETSINALKWQFEDTAAKVILTEAEFGLNSKLPGFKIKLNNGSTAYLRGFIDRVDILEGEQSYFRVVDYKSSQKKFNKDEFLAGINIQLIIYLMVLSEYFKERNAKPSGAYYFDLSLDYLQKEDEIDAYREKRMNGISVDDIGTLIDFSGKTQKGELKAIKLKLSKNGIDRTGAPVILSEDQLSSLFDYTKDLVTKALNEIYEGNISINPIKIKTNDSGVCRYCRFKSICRFDETYSGNEFRTACQEKLFGETND